MDGRLRSPVVASCLVSDPVIDEYKKDIDRSLVRENLKLSVEARFRKLQQLQRFAAELRRAGRAADHDRLRKPDPGAR